METPALPLASGRLVFPPIGLGTWRMGESRGARAAEVRALRTAFELGYRLIDTAEMYGEGGAEEVVGVALEDAVRAGDLRRDEVTIVSKVYPHNASRRGTAEACERSRRRLKIDTIDLYLLHWRGEHPLPDTVGALEELAGKGRIGRWGVSNFDLDDMQELAGLPGAESACATNQVYFSLGERGPEFSLLPWMRERGMPLMAYSPIDQGRAAEDTVLQQIGAARGVTAAQVALAWVVSRPGVMAIPKAGREAHLRENLAAAAITLSEAERRRLDAAFPSPTRKTPLAMI